jgi:hypothetical protein
MRNNKRKRNTMMHYTDDEREQIDPAQQDQDNELIAHGQRQDIIEEIQLIHTLAEAYIQGTNRMVGGDPTYHSPRGYKAAMEVAQAFVKTNARLQPADAHHVWRCSMLMCGDPISTQPPDVLTSFEQLGAVSQAAERAAVMEMRKVVTPEVQFTKKAYQSMSDSDLNYWMNQDREEAKAEVMRRRPA